MRVMVWGQHSGPAGRRLTSRVLSRRLVLAMIKRRIAGHASPKTTKLDDRTADAITVDEIERIVI